MQQVDTRAKPAFPRPIAVWWLDCPKTSHDLYMNRRKPISPSQLTRFRSRPKDLDSLSSSPRESSYRPSSLLSSSQFVDRDDDWIHIGHPDQDQPSYAAAYSMERRLDSGAFDLSASLSTLTLITIVANVTYWFFFRFT